MSNVLCEYLPFIGLPDVTSGSTERAYLTLEERLATLAMPPGWTGTIEALRAELAIERTALSKALGRLVCFGLIEISEETVVV